MRMCFRDLLMKFSYDHWNQPARVGGWFRRSKGVDRHQLLLLLTSFLARISSFFSEACLSAFFEDLFEERNSSDDLQETGLSDSHP